MRMATPAGEFSRNEYSQVGWQPDLSTSIDLEGFFSALANRERHPDYVESDRPGAHYFRTEKPRLRHRTPAQQAEFAFWLDGVNASRRAAQRRAAEARS